MLQILFVNDKINVRINVITREWWSDDLSIDKRTNICRVVKPEKNIPV